MELIDMKHELEDMLSAFNITQERFDQLNVYYVGLKDRVAITREWMSDSQVIAEMIGQCNNLNEATYIAFTLGRTLTEQRCPLHANDEVDLRGWREKHTDNPIEAILKSIQASILPVVEEPQPKSNKGRKSKDDILTGQGGEA